MTLKIMGTGSRSMITHTHALDIYKNLEAYILKLKDHHDGDIEICSGMAEGWDEAIAKVAFRNNIPYIVAIPNTNYGSYYWKRKSLLNKDRMVIFSSLVSAAKEVHYISDQIYVNGVHANFIRNQWMVDWCDVALVYSAQSSGTRDAVARLTSAKKPYFIYPFTLQESLPI